VIKHKFELKADGGKSGNLVIEATSYVAFREIQKKVEMLLWQALDWQKVRVAKVGDGGSINLSVSWNCTMSGRAPARPKDVIAAEKAARAAKSQARREERERWKKEAAQRVLNLRQRIKHEVDHAFAVGKSGTEPASKYITCEHCHAPAAYLCLNRAITRGAAVLDEDTIVGALCAAHGQHHGNLVVVPCSKLEFFYDGIRQIAIKP
jgi:hypothetical protein